jgi:hypothetical protein
MTRLSLKAFAATLALAAALIPPWAGAALAAPPEKAGGGNRVLTGKERLTSKGMDEQRVDDCKVPEALRGKRQRPADCGGRR